MALDDTAVNSLWTYWNCRGTGHAVPFPGPHEGLRDPFTPSRVLTPNEKYAALLSVSGYVPVPLEAEQYLELLPAETRVINSYGVKIRHRVYDCED